MQGEQDSINALMQHDNMVLTSSSEEDYLIYGRGAFSSNKSAQLIQDLITLKLAHMQSFKVRTNNKGRAHSQVGAWLC